MREVLCKLSCGCGVAGVTMNSKLAIARIENTLKKNGTTTSMNDWVGE